MNTKHLASFFASAVLILTTGCSQENNSDAPVNPGMLDAGEASYFALTVATSQGTKSQEGDYSDSNGEIFNEGLQSESAINPDSESHCILFFDKEGIFTGWGNMNPYLANGITSFTVKQTGKVTLPDQCLVILNYDPEKINALVSIKPKLYEALAAVVDDTDSSNGTSNGYFTMTTSVYADNGVAVSATQLIDKIAFYNTEEEALAAPVAVIPVDRLATKISLGVASGDSEYYFNSTSPLIINQTSTLPVVSATGSANSNWKINLVSWSPNVLEKSEYLVKGIGDGSGTGWRTTYPDWNDFAEQRSFWAIDTHYDKSDYPEQYRPSLNVAGVSSVAELTVYPQTKENETVLSYLSYNQMAENRAENLYAPENTFDASLINYTELASKPWLRCGTGAMLLGQLLIEDIDGYVYAKTPTSAGFISGVKDKYYTEGSFYSEETLLTKLYKDFKYSLATETTVIPDILKGGTMQIYPAVREFYDKEGNVISNIADYFELVPAFIKGGDGWVSLALKEGMTVYVLGAGNQNVDSSALKALNREEAASYIYAFVPMAKCFKEGRMYYPVSIWHNVARQTSNPTEIATADFGVVRNHWYRLHVGSITSVGIPVQDPDQPVIPNPEPGEGEIDVQVQLIPWHVISYTIPKL